jgi:hypothetical protein
MITPENSLPRIWTMESKTDPTDVGMVDNPKNANCEKEAKRVS